MKTYADRDGTFPLVHAVTDEWIVMSFLDDIRILNYMDNTMAFWTVQNADDVERVSTLPAWQTLLRDSAQLYPTDPDLRSSPTQRPTPSSS